MSDLLKSSKSVQIITTYQENLGNSLFVLDSGPSVTDWIGAVSAFLTFVVAGFALLFASGQVKEAKKSRKQVADIEREKAQPMVIVSMEPAASPYIQEIVVKNYGQTPAYDVKLVSDPPIQRTGDRDRATPEDVEIPEVIPYLAPGQEWRTIWDTGRERAQYDDTFADLHEVTVTFKGLNGEILSSNAILDWGPLKSTRFMTTYGLHDLSKAVVEMNKLHKKWTEHTGGLNVWMRDGDARDQRRAEAIRQARENGERLKAQFGFGEEQSSESSND